MKKQHKAIAVMGIGVFVDWIGAVFGVSFFDGRKSLSNLQSNLAASKPSCIPTEKHESLSKWLAEINPAAGTNKVIDQNGH
ncbi:hypothetical protein KJ742_01085 [Patescibacteria group bacterium]|nr:hypothetical protein [Patescibacteria group bacterium]